MPERLPPKPATTAGQFDLFGKRGIAQGRRIDSVSELTREIKGVIEGRFPHVLVKGEVSEKLALRQAAAIGPSATKVRSARQWLPPGLDDPRWDFSPKEEPASDPRRGLGAVAQDLALQWSLGLGGVCRADRERP